MGDLTVIKNLKDQFNKAEALNKAYANEFKYLDTLYSNLNDFYDNIKALPFDFDPILTWTTSYNSTSMGYDNVIINPAYSKGIPQLEYDEPKRKAFIQAFQKIVWDFQGKIINEYKTGKGSFGDYKSYSDAGTALQNIIDCYTGVTKATIWVDRNKQTFFKQTDIPKSAVRVVKLDFNGFQYVSMNPFFYPPQNSHTPNVVLEWFRIAYPQIQNLADLWVRKDAVDVSQPGSLAQINNAKLPNLLNNISDAGGNFDNLELPPNSGDGAPPPSDSSVLNPSQTTSTGLSTLQISMIVIGGLFLLIGGGIILTRSK